MGFPALKEEYRPKIEEVLQRVLESKSLEGYLYEPVSALLDGSQQDQAECLRAFAILLKKLVSKTESALIEEHFDQKDY